MPEGTIRASDVGRYVYCARAWWLQRVMGNVPHNQAALDRGEARHKQHGRNVAASQRQNVLAGGIAVLALVLLFVFIVSWFWG